MILVIAGQPVTATATDTDREAFQSIWIGFGLIVKDCMVLDDAKQHRLAQDSAHSWLEQAGWRGDEHEEKKEQLGEYVDHIRQLIDDLGG